MVNIDDFVKRLEIILDYYALNASSFADKIGVQRSSMSHLLSGRNKPSLDFVMKIMEVFPDVDLYWILNGKGSFPKSNSKSTESEPITNINPIPAVSTQKNKVNEDLFSETIPEEIKSVPTPNRIENQNILFDDNIEKIVFFYKDGTFKTFNPNAKK